MAKKESTSIKRKLKKIRGENEPKKPTTEYFRFLRDERKNLPEGLSVKDQTKVLSKKWAELSAESKAKYAQEYAVALEEYKKAQEKYKQTDEYQEVLKKNKEQKQNEKNNKDEPKKKVPRKPSGYNLFVKEERASMTKDDKGANALSFKEISQIISKKWQELSAEAKEEYKTKAAGAESIENENVEP
ncbi:hypothetical protein NEOKW01_0218 [Nematocida sp. AWRm80]|nr:hypothetical protein NEOKW01_0218 [Nematocida sp. AWRm80]